MSRPVKNMVSSAAAVLLSLCAAQAVADPAVIYFPSGAVDGLGPQTYDQGTVFSASLLQQQKLAGRLPGNPTTTFTPAMGSGGAGVLVYSGNNVQATNTAYGFAQSIDAVGADVDDTWVGGTVGGMRNYLNSLTSVANSLQPLFVFDHNENSQGSNLRISALVTVGTTQFAFDNVGGGIYVASDYVLSCGEVSIGPLAPLVPPCSIPFPTTSGFTYEWDANGQGKPDYYALFQGLNIWSNSYNANDVFKVQISMRDNYEAGFEELAIGGYNFHRPTTDVPEPGSMALFGLGLVALSLVGRRRVKKSD